MSKFTLHNKNQYELIFGPTILANHFVDRLETPAWASVVNWVSKITQTYKNLGSLFAPSSNLDFFLQWLTALKLLHYNIINIMQNKIFISALSAPSDLEMNISNISLIILPFLTKNLQFLFQHLYYHFFHCKCKKTCRMKDARNRSSE